MEVMSTYVHREVAKIVAHATMKMIGLRPS